MLEPAERAAIEQLERRWLTCELEGLPADVLELCSDDVVWLPPGRPPIRGKDAIRAWLAPPMTTSSTSVYERRGRG